MYILNIAEFFQKLMVQKVIFKIIYESMEAFLPRSFCLIFGRNILYVARNQFLGETWVRNTHF